jgi:hypothetical protein
MMMEIIISACPERNRRGNLGKGGGGGGARPELVEKARSGLFLSLGLGVRIREFQNKNALFFPCFNLK